MALDVEGVVDGGMDREEFLRRADEVAPENGTTGLVGRSLLQMTWNGAEHDESETED